MRRVTVLAVAVAVGAGLLGGCASDTGKPEVQVTMREFSLKVSPTIEDEGAVRIFIDNVGELEHSLVFARVKDLSELPLLPEGNVDLAKVLLADRLENVGPGRYRINPDLRFGPMVLFCNLVTADPDGPPVSHLQQGMWAKLTMRRTRSGTSVPNVGPPGS